MATADEIERNLVKKLEMSRNRLLNDFVEKVASTTQKTFNKYEVEVSADNPHVSVHTSPFHKESEDKVSRSVICSGEQVLFIEFGVGYNNSLIKSTVSDDGKKVRWGGKTGNQGAYGFEEGGVDEIYPRPAGIVPLGFYGKGLGRDDYWIRPSAFGIPNTHIGESHVHRADGSVRTDVVWTAGHNPLRALYRAVRNAEKNIGR